jgi:hypothetical protein
VESTPFIAGGKEDCVYKYTPEEGPR